MSGASPAAAAAPARPAAGISLILLSSLCFASLDTTSRHVGQTTPLLVMLWARYGFQAAAMALWLARGWRGATFRTAHPRFQLLRGLLLLASSALAFTALRFMPVPEFTAIIMLTPVIVAVLARWVLKERLSRLRWALVIGAFAGALIVIRPGSGLFGWAVVLPLLGALVYAMFQLLSSRMAALESPYTTHFYTGAVGLAVVTPLLWIAPQDLLPALRAEPARELGLLLLIGLLGTVGHLFLILGLGQAPAATLMPFLYSQIPAAALVAWLVSGHLPDAWAWLGMAIITLCGAGTAWLNLGGPGRKPLPTVAADTVAD